MPNVIDLYAGAGGLSLGASRAGFNVSLAIEFDKNAMGTHKKNFPNTIHIERDIQSISIDEIKQALGDEELCGVIGGPPCQGFSTMGYGNVNDKRNLLFRRFFEIVSELRPKFFLAENVPGIMQEKYANIRRDAFNLVENSYTLLKPILVKASDYGAATTRTRYFFIGIRNDINTDLSEQSFLDAKTPDSLQTNVKAALEGLPLGIKYDKNQSGSVALESCYFDKRRKHLQNQNYYARMTDLIPPGVGDSTFIKQYKKNHITNGFLMTKHTPNVVIRFQSLNCGKQDVVSKAYKLNPSSFCPTLRAGTGPDKGSYQAVRPIHYSEPRVITPREAARLQGFPDWFELPDTIWHSFRQIGNSVSPIVAEAILNVIKEHLTII